MSLEAFINETGHSIKQLNSVELAVTTDVYNYIKSGTSSSSIFDQYNGVSLKNAAKSNAFEWAAAPAKGGKGCRFWCWFQRIVEILIIIASW